MKDLSEAWLDRVRQRDYRSAYEIWKQLFESDEQCSFAIALGLSESRQDDSALNAIRDFYEWVKKERRGYGMATQSELWQVLSLIAKRKRFGSVTPSGSGGQPDCDQSLEETKVRLEMSKTELCQLAPSRAHPEQVRVFLNGLTDVEHRAIVVLRQCGFLDRQIASVLGCSIDTVKNMVDEVRGLLQVEEGHAMPANAITNHQSEIS